MKPPLPDEMQELIMTKINEQASPLDILDCIQDRPIENGKAIPDKCLRFNGMTSLQFVANELYEFQEATGCDTSDEYKKRDPVAWMDCLGQVRNQKELEMMKARGDSRYKTYDIPLFK